jgi:hypothetical protein
MFCTGDFHDQQSKEIIGGISESKEEQLFSGVALSSSPSLSLVLRVVLCRRKAEGSACIQHVRLAGGWLVLVSCERKVLLAGLF